jgi:hypothetical protein
MVPQFCPQALAPQTAPCGHLVPAYPIPDYAALHSLLPILGHQTSLVLGFNILQMLCAAPVYPAVCRFYHINVNSPTLQRGKVSIRKVK